MPKIVIIADIHVGDRTDKLDPKLLKASDKKPNANFACRRCLQAEVIATLGEIAPTLAVQGNRDWPLGYKLPKEERLEINGLKITLAHGHFSIWEWFWNYVYLFLTQKPHTNRFYQQKLAKIYPEADIIVYGHLHYPYDEMMDGKRFLNPGVGYPEKRNNFRPTYIVLTIEPDGRYRTALKSAIPEA